MVLQFSLNHLDEAKLLTCICIKAAMRSEPNLKILPDLLAWSHVFWKRDNLEPQYWNLSNRVATSARLETTTVFFLNGWKLQQNIGISRKPKLSSAAFCLQEVVKRRQSVLTCWHLLEFL